MIVLQKEMKPSILILQVDSDSVGKVILPTTTTIVTISDDESLSSFDYTSFVDKVITKISSKLSTELKVLTDANSADS